MTNPGERLFDPQPTRKVLDDIFAERFRQVMKWGEQNVPDGTNEKAWAIDLERARVEFEDAYQGDTLTWAHILHEEFLEALCETDPVKLREELIQVAAVAAAWCEAIDRRGRVG